MKKIRVALLVEEFFSNSMPFRNGKGGYGMLARNYIAEFIPDDTIEVDTICDFNDKNELLIHTVDLKKVLFLPNYSPKTFFEKLYKKVFLRNNPPAKKIVNQYDVFISIEMSNITYSVLQMASRDQKLILWIQDPRTKEDLEEIYSVPSNIREKDGYGPNDYRYHLLNELYEEKRLVLISQGDYLIKKAIELYDLKEDSPVSLVRNPVFLPAQETIDVRKKKNKIISLGRLDFVKRPWIIGEVAKLLPQYDFYFLGQAHDKDVLKIMSPYYNLENCHFVGHIEGEEKDKLLKESKLLINTSIHEAIPISFLEALSYGILLISNRDPDGLTSRFGFYTGQVNGDGYADAELFKNGIETILQNEEQRVATAIDAIKYVNEFHNINRFITELRQKIREAII